MAKIALWSLFTLVVVTVEYTYSQRAFQAYTVQDIADLQNEVLYETFDYFYFSQERQLTTIFERLAQIENRLNLVMATMGLSIEEEVDEGEIVAPAEERATEQPPPTPRSDYEVMTPFPPVVQPMPMPVKPNRRQPNRQQPPNRQPTPSRNTPRPRRPQRPTTRPTTKPTTRPTTQPTTTPPEPTPPPYAMNCAEIFQRGLWSSRQNLYAIDPIGNGNLIDVKCEMESDAQGREKVYTVIGHSQMRSKKVTGFENPGEFSLAPSYNASAKQLRAITAASPACSQYIEYRCRGAVLMTPSRNGGTYGFWRDINGETVESWGGAPSNSRLCACGVDGTCEGGGSCHCDSNSKTFLTDDGLITDKGRLPVMDVRLGDTGGKKETGYVRLGELRCE